ncbi:MAG TPA: lipocalin family protein [Marinilabiliaceae bacterium]|nr:lipocalin family protein [Marinilabiliaceae bacterium]
MKNLILTLVVALFMVGCSKDDDNKISNSDLIGTWVLTSSETTVKVMGQSVTEPDEMDPDWKEYFIFKEDGTYKYQEEYLGKLDFSESGNYKLSGDEISLTSNGETTTSKCQIKGGKTLILSEKFSMMGIESEVISTYTKE